MDIFVTKYKILSEEKECHLSYDYLDKKWYMDTTVMKYYNKAKNKGWIQKAEYRYDDGTICGGKFEAPPHAITIRNFEKKQMSDKQMGNLCGLDDEDE